MTAENLSPPLCIVLPYPLSANRYWASRVIPGKNIPMVYVTSDAKAYKQDVAWRCAAAGIKAPISGRVSVHVQLFPSRPLDWKTRQRKHGDAWDDTVQCIDLDNANKVLLDALKDVAVDDDKWVRRLTSERMEPDEHGARVVVTIAALPAQHKQMEMV